MEDKLFELMTRMYSDISMRFDTIESKINNIESKVDDNTSELKSLGNQVTAIESDINDDIKALYDGYKKPLNWEKKATVF